MNNLCLKIDLVSHPANGKGVRYIYIYIIYIVPVYIYIYIYIYIYMYLRYQYLRSHLHIEWQASEINKPVLIPQQQYLID